MVGSGSGAPSLDVIDIATCWVVEAERMFVFLLFLTFFRRHRPHDTRRNFPYPTKSQRLKGACHAQKLPF